MSIFLFVVVGAQRSPTISFISQEKVVNIGDTVELECTVQYTSDYHVSNCFVFVSYKDDCVLLTYL